MRKRIKDPPMQLRTFPKAIIQSRGRQTPINVQMNHKLHPGLMAKTALHQETLARLGLCRNLSEHTATKHVNDIVMEAQRTIRGSSATTAKILMASQSTLNPESQMLQAVESPLNGLEFFGLIR